MKTKWVSNYNLQINSVIAFGTAKVRFYFALFHEGENETLTNECNERVTLESKKFHGKIYYILKTEGKQNGSLN